MPLETLSNNRCFEGEQLRFKHHSETLNCAMNFSVYLPPGAKSGQVPVLYWLSGLTCTDENFVTKAGAQRYAAEHGIALVMPDTSPRGDGVSDDPEAAYDFGLGAGFYVNATEEPWSRHYHMYDYVSDELPELLKELAVIDTQRASISGHSMGGHGAITIGLNNPQNYRSISAFAPISSPTRCPWGKKALGGYLGNDPRSWMRHDSALLIESASNHLPLLVDQGDADNFLEEQLKPELLIDAAAKSQYPLQHRMQAGYDHSYFFIASFIRDHIAFHAKFLKN